MQNELMKKQLENENLQHNLDIEKTELEQQKKVHYAQSAVLQWNLQTRETLGGNNFVLCREVVPISEGPLSEVSLYMFVVQKMEEAMKTPYRRFHCICLLCRKWRKP